MRKNCALKVIYQVFVVGGGFLLCDLFFPTLYLIAYMEHSNSFLLYKFYIWSESQLGV